MLPNLTNLPINQTFGGILHTSNQAVSASDFRKIYDGYGNETPLSLSNNAVKIGNVTYATQASTNGSALFYENGGTIFKSLLDSVYPIGAIYLSMNSANPTSIFGGSWNQIGQGKFLVGVGTGKDSNFVDRDFVLGNNKGEYSHTLNVEEIASHNHVGASSIGRLPLLDGNGNQVIGSKPVGEIQIAGVFGDNTTPTGGNKSHENTPPSFGVYMWQRTS
jgi:hypothetical protein